MKQPKITLWKGYKIIQYEDEVGFKTYNVYKGKAYLNSFVAKEDAKEYIEKFNKKYGKIIEEKIAEYIKILLEEENKK